MQAYGFHRGMRWHVGSEGRTGVLERRHDLHRCRCHGADGMACAVGLGVIASTLLSIAADADRRARAAA